MRVAWAGVAIIATHLVTVWAHAADTDAEARGKKLFVNCAMCHSVDEDGDNGIGPNLWGVFGSPAAAKPDFDYSAALKGSHISWTDAMLDKWLSGPAAMVPGTKMGFAGLPDAADRQAIIAYLKSQSSKK